jgi:hypothetical protein
MSSAVIDLMQMPCRSGSEMSTEEWRLRGPSSGNEDGTTDLSGMDVSFAETGGRSGWRHTFGLRRLAAALREGASSRTPEASPAERNRNSSLFFRQRFFSGPYPGTKCNVAFRSARGTVLYREPFAERKATNTRPFALQRGRAVRSHAVAPAARRRSTTRSCPRLIAHASGVAQGSS